MRPTSLRSRLFLMIVGPLVIFASLSSIARYGQFSLLARQLYDNALLTIALTISREIIVNEGDLPTRNVLDALAKSLGDTIYYRVTGPDGAYVTGYSPAPRVPANATTEPGKPFYFDATYQGRPVRALYMTEDVQDLPNRGLVTMEVWQTINQRQQLSFGLISQSALYFALLVLVVALAVWFGIRRGLRPLKALEEDVRTRTPEDLHPIRKIVPIEIGTLVAAMNTLFGRLTEAFAIRDAFISDAAHQMRTPISGIQAQAEAALTAKSETTLRERIFGLALAARHAGRLTHQLLSMERVRGSSLRSMAKPFDIEPMVADTARHFAERALPRGIEVNYHMAGAPVPYVGDEVLLRELLVNLLENAEKYGASSAPQIEVALTFHESGIELCVSDNGPGIPEAMHQRVFDRFFRAAPENSIGCGLGLAIVRDVARAHGGEAGIRPVPQGCCVCISLPSG